MRGKNIIIRDSLVATLSGCVGAYCIELALSLSDMDLSHCLSFQIKGAQKYA